MFSRSLSMVQLSLLLFFVGILERKDARMNSGGIVGVSAFFPSNTSTITETITTTISLFTMTKTITTTISMMTETESESESDSRTKKTTSLSHSRSRLSTTCTPSAESSSASASPSLSRTSTATHETPTHTTTASTGTMTVTHANVHLRSGTPTAFSNSASPSPSPSPSVPSTSFSLTDTTQSGSPSISFTEVTHTKSISPSASLSQTPTVQPFETREPLPPAPKLCFPLAATAEEIPTTATSDAALRTEQFNWSFALPVVVGSWYLNTGRLEAGVDINTTFFQLTLQLGEGLPSIKGFSSLAPKEVGAQLQWVNATAMFLELNPFPSSYSIQEDEILELRLTPAYFSTACRPQDAMTIARVVVNSVPSAVAVSTATSVAVVTGSSIVVSSVSAGGALDAQTVAVIGMMSCAGPVDRKAMKNPRLLSPLTIDSSYEGMIVGNVLLLALVAIGQLVAVVVIRKVKRFSWQYSRMYAKFPALLYTVSCVTFQGTAIAALKLLATDDDVGIQAFGVFGAAVCALTPIVAMVIVWRYVTAEFHQYDMSTFNDGKWNKLPFSFLFPHGRWEPDKVRKAYGGLFAGVRRSGLWWVPLTLWSPILMVVGASFRPSTRSECEIQYAVMSSIQLLMVVILIIFRPYRSAMANVLSTASYFCLALILIGSTLAVNNSSPASQRLILAAVQAQTAVTGLRLLWTVIQMWLERKLTECPTKVIDGLSRIAAAPRKKKAVNREDDSVEGSDDELLLVPLAGTEEEEGKDGAPEHSNMQFTLSVAEDKALVELAANREDEAVTEKKKPSRRAASISGPALPPIPIAIVPAEDAETLSHNPLAVKAGEGHKQTTQIPSGIGSIIPPPPLLKRNSRQRPLAPESTSSVSMVIGHR